MKDEVASKIHLINHWKDLEKEEFLEPQFTKGYTKAVKWTEQERHLRCNGEDRLFDKILMTANNYEKSLEIAQQQRQALTNKSSPMKGGVIMSGNQNNQSGVDSSRVNQSNLRPNDNDISNINGPAAGNDVSKVLPLKKDN